MCGVVSPDQGKLILRERRQLKTLPLERTEKKRKENSVAWKYSPRTQSEISISSLCLSFYWEVNYCSFSSLLPYLPPRSRVAQWTTHPVACTVSFLDWQICVAFVCQVGGSFHFLCLAPGLSVGPSSLQYTQKSRLCSAENFLRILTDSLKGASPSDQFPILIQLISCSADVLPILCPGKWN